MLKALLLLALLPPINLAILTLLGLVLMRLRPRLGRTISLLSACGLLALSLHAVTTPMLAALERDLPIVPPSDAPPGAIVVLSGDSLRSPSVPGGYTVGALTLMRLRTAAALHRKTGLPLLVSGGAVPRDKAPPLADLMTRSLREDFGVPVGWVERNSGDTQENAVFSAEILRAQGITSVYVVTHAWHMRRSLNAFAATGLTVTAAPTPLLPPIGPILADFIPTVSSWQTAYFAAHEWVGLLWYSIR